MRIVEGLAVGVIGLLLALIVLSLIGNHHDWTTSAVVVGIVLLAGLYGIARKRQRSAGNR